MEETWSFLGATSPHPTNLRRQASRPSTSRSTTRARATGRNDGHGVLLRGDLRRAPAAYLRRRPAADPRPEVFRIAFEYHRSGRKLTSPWLYTTLRHLVANQYRRARRELDYLATLGAGRRDAAGEGATDAALVVAHALRRLAKDDREILRMAYWEDLSRAEIAAVLGCSAGAVRVRLLRARKRLAAILGEPAAPSLPGGGRR